MDFEKIVEEINKIQNKEGNQLSIPQKAEKWIDYFTCAIEEWRKSRDIGKISLFGFQYGAYITAHFARKFHESVDHLILSSPFGLTHQAWEENKVEDRVKEFNSKILTIEEDEAKGM